MLCDQLIRLMQEGYEDVFSQTRTRDRAIELSLGALCSLGKRTVSRAICAVGRQHQDWSADYKVFSRSRWEEDHLFDSALKEYVARYPIGPIPIAFDDTKLPKTGSHIPSAFWQKDPLSPPFHVNLLFGLRFMQASLLFPHYREGDFSARGIPVRFKGCPAVKKPGKRASEAEREAYREAKKLHNLSVQGLEVMKNLRDRLDFLGYADRRMTVVVDGSLCNRTIFKTPLDRIDLVARCRKDARLCHPAPEGSRRKYSSESFTPEQVRQDLTIPWHETKIYFGGKKRIVRYKIIENVLWQRGAGTRPLRLMVLAAQPYKTSQNAKINYRQPAYLLTTALNDSAKYLIQTYVDRWQIEVNHRDEKQILGVGQAQVWSPLSVPRQPALAVASYSMLLLAALKEFGPGRTEEFILLPKWRKQATRPSALDMVALLRKDICHTGGWKNVKQKIAQNIQLYAYT